MTRDLTLSPAPAGEPLSRRFLAGLAVAWLGVTVPLTFLGHGSDPDAWEVARVAEHFFTTRRYLVSRSSGFPLFEMLSAPFVHTGSYAISNLPALLSGIALLSAFVALARAGRLAHPRLLLIAVAFSPIILRNATSTMDFLGGLALLTWSFVALSSGRPLTSSLLVGIAAGFRPTNALFMLPVLVHHYREHRSLAASARMAAVSAATAVFAFSPVLVTYGLRTGFKDMRLSAAKQLMMVGYVGLQTFGALQSMVVLGVTIHALCKPREGARAIRDVPSLDFHLTAIGAYLALFLLMPHESEYLLPAVPSLLLILDQVLDARRFLVLTCALLSYHLFRVELAGGESGDRKLAVSLRAGYLYRDVQARRFALSVRAAATSARLEQPTILMFGVDEITSNNPAFEALGKSLLFKQRGGRLFISPAIVQDERLSRLEAKGFRIVLWRGARGELMFRRDTDSWRRYVDEISSLEELLGRPIDGAPLYQ